MLKLFSIVSGLATSKAVTCN